MVDRQVWGVPTQITMAYDEANRLMSQTADGATTTYEYDAQGGLISRTGGGETTHYMGGRFEVNATTGEVTKYYFFNGQRLAMRKGGTLTYLLSDHLGSTSTVLDDAGAVLATQHYYPFGRTRAVTGTMGTDKPFGNAQGGALHRLPAGGRPLLRPGPLLRPDVGALHPG